MKAQETISESMRPQAVVAMIVGSTEPRALVLPEHTTQTATSAHSIPPALQKEAEKFREQMRRRYETPYEMGWDHGGLNE